MEFRICPICEKQGLIKSIVRNVAKKRIVCENESFIHFKIGDVHFLAHTEAAVKEEQRLELALN